MQAFLRDYSYVIFDVLIFIMIYAWCYFGSGGSHDAKTKKVRYGVPALGGAVVLLVVQGMGAIETHMDVSKCKDLPANEGVVINDRCYKRVDGSVYVPVDTVVRTME